MNIVILSGRLTEDPEVRYMDNEDQTAFCFFTLAVTKEYDRNNADFIRCKVFGKSAEVLGDYTKKGQQINVRGRWDTGSYEDKKGNTVYTNDCRVDRVELVGSKKETEEEDRKPDRKKGRR